MHTIKRLLLGLVLASVAFAQAPTIWGVDATTLTTFDHAYWAAQPVPVQALQGMDPAGPARAAQAYSLAGQKYFIDVPIMVWGQDPYITMLQRQVDGYTTYQDGLGGQSRPVDLNPADYPPVVPPPPPASPLVGAQIGGPGSPYYFLTTLAAASKFPTGYQTTQAGHLYVLQYITQQSLSGQSQQIGRWYQLN